MSDNALDNGIDERADQSDQIKPWTVKGIAPEDRNAAISAADRAGMKIGEWLSRAIRAQAQADFQVSRTPPIPVGQPVGQEPMRSDLDAMDRLIAMAERLSATAGEPPPKGVIALGYGRIRERMKQLKVGNNGSA
jgi:hypothetical protein